MLDVNPTYRMMLAVDIQRSAGRGDVALLGNQDVLFTALRESCVDSGIDWDACHREDRGDGMRLVAGPEIPKPRFLYPLMRDLAQRLRAHNRTAGPLSTIRVRAALHAGDVHMRDGRIAGSSLERLARLLDAPPLRSALDAAPEQVTVALIVSDHIRDTVVRHGYVGIDPETYRQVTFRVKESTLTGWLHLPDAALAMVDGGGAAGSHRAAAAASGDQAGTGAMVIHATNVNLGGQQGDQIGHVGYRIDHVTGSVHVGPRPVPDGDDGLRAQIAELRRLLLDLRQRGQIDEETFAAAQVELRDADSHASCGDQDGRKRLVLALRRLKGLVEDVADFAAKVASVISAVRSA